MVRTKRARRVERKVFFRGRLVSLEVDRVIEPGGREVEREVCRHPGAAAVLALTGEDEVVLVRQYRYAVDEFLWEVPAGTLASGETPDETARREFLEETGFYPHRLEKLAELFAAPGFTDERLHLFMASELEEQAPCPDEDEAIEVGVFSLEEVRVMLEQGRIRESKTMVALLSFSSRRS